MALWQREPHVVADDRGEEDGVEPAQRAAVRPEQAARVRLRDRYAA